MVTIVERIKAKTTIPEATKKEIIAPVLEAIRTKHNGLLIADHVVDEARKKNSPLHPYFNWDDTKAAHQYRLWRACVMTENSQRVLTVVFSMFCPIVIYAISWCEKHWKT